MKYYKKSDIKITPESNDGAIITLQVLHADFVKPTYACNKTYDVITIGKRKNVEALIKDLQEVLDNPWIQE